MKILAIETSCDETAIAYVEARGDESSADFSILGNGLLSQIDIHKQYGGVYPAVAKREHAKNLVAVLDTALASNAPGRTVVNEKTLEEIHALLAREVGLADALIAYLETHGEPELNAIAVTHGPGLAPALWVGVNFAKALALAWNVPIVGVNHMEGHLLSALATKDSDNALSIHEPKLPVLALLISGGHTELVLMKAWGEYELIGRTRDDAVGEAYDKVARMLVLPYPGGPEISKLAEAAREEKLTDTLSLPRPMLDSGNHDFSFAGLKTAVLYLLKGASETDPKHVAYAFEEAVGEVLAKKTSHAIDRTGAATLAIGGGVSANIHIRRVFDKLIEEHHPDVSLFIPHASLTGDNAVMIAIACFYRIIRKEYADPETLAADGNLSLA
ncbi:MAG: tRNA (adenosine(37)-N6)-threonylcarbamoyltransferase complex transferase subunit TsaD [Candidatus Pacebacteria bacterium]|nr:tRNA (adenosine(37)-N6)-threonylcarbamoyltransferase complex transferase subunit TsaD [Candidatus Paceibacterota bacterium]MBP9840372.1 tRNA (adenosine(37)-N6)-threonylcarbamoyltransferase complex transferase subunit TsaD [Candidatus Paceibacterota bacterium]